MALRLIADDQLLCKSSPTVEHNFVIYPWPGDTSSASQRVQTPIFYCIHCMLAGYLTLPDPTADAATATP